MDRGSTFLTYSVPSYTSTPHHPRPYPKGLNRDSVEGEEEVTAGFGRGPTVFSPTYRGSSSVSSRTGSVVWSRRVLLYSVHGVGSRGSGGCVTEGV